MAALLRTATAFKISRTLFNKDDGSPYRFYFENDSEDLRCILRKGLGYLVNDPAEADILLCEKKTDNRITQGYLPIDFIVDCVKRNAFLNVDTYRADVLGLNASSSKDECLNSRINARDDSEEEGNLVKFSEPVHIRVKPDGLLGRKKYTDLDDFNIINYLIQHKKYTETGGNAVWKQMELVKVTDHPYQSMKARFQKKIRPEIDTYNISDIWKAKLCGDCTDDGSGGDEESVQDMTFGYIDKWKDNLKKSSNKKRMMISSEADKRTFFSGSSTRTVVNDQPSAAVRVTSRTQSSDSSTRTVVNNLPAAASRVTSEASTLNDSAADSCRTAVANLNGSDLELLTVNSSNEMAQAEAEHCDKAISHSGNLLESTLHQPGVDADKEQGTQSADYIYDDMDCLILSEANKYQNIDGGGTVSNQPSGSGAGATTRKQSQIINNFSHDEIPPINSKNVSQHPYNNTAKKDTRKVILNIHFNSAKTTSSSENESPMKNNKSSDQQKETSDEMVGVSEEHVNSINTILNIIKKGSSKSRRETDSLLSKNRSSKVKDIESDTCCNAKPARKKAAMQIPKSRSISPIVQSEHTHPRRKKQVDKNNVKESAETSPKTAHKEIVTRKGSVSKSNSDSDDFVEETSLHIKAPMPNHKSRHVSLVAMSSDVLPLRMAPEKERNDKNVKSAEKSPKNVHTKLANRKASSSKSHSDSDDSVEETSEQQANSSNRFLNATFTTNKRALESDESYDSSSVNYSPHKKKRLQHCSQARPVTASTRLSNESLQSSLKEGKSSDWCGKEETVFRVEYLSKVYGLEIREAALLLKLHNGSFHSVIKHLDS